MTYKGKFAQTFLPSWHCEDLLHKTYTNGRDKNMENEDKDEKGVIRSLDRGLRVLRAIGRHGADPASLAKVTSIDRATIYRILHTLAVKGYLTRNPSDHRYRLTREVRILGDNFTDLLWVAEVGAPEVGTLFREIGWPTNLATFDGDQMYVRESTHRFCSLMTHRTMVGTRIHMATSLGQVFAAYAGATAQPGLVKLIARDGVVTEGEAHNRLQQAQARGYSIAIDALEEDIIAIAMPVIHRGNVIAAMNIVVPANLVPMVTIESDLQVALLASRNRLERALDIMEDIEAA